MTIGEYLRQARKSKGYSLSYIAKHLNATRQYISLLELDKQHVPVDVLDTLVLLLDLDRYKAHKLNNSLPKDLFYKFVKYQDVLEKVASKLETAENKFMEAFLNGIN